MIATFALFNSIIPYHTSQIKAFPKVYAGVGKKYVGFSLDILVWCGKMIVLAARICQHSNRYLVGLSLGYLHQIAVQSTIARHALTERGIQ